jgi:hypothetical protein
MSLATDIQGREYEKFVEVVSGTTAVRVSHQIGSYTGTVNVGSAKALGTLTSTINGLVRNITQNVPAMGSITGTATTCLIDGGGGTVIALAAQAENTLLNYGTIVPINTSMKFITITTGDANGTITTAGGADIVLTVNYEL